MTQPSGRREVFSNPFFVLLLGASLAFVLTTLGYLVSPSILVPDPTRPRPAPGSVRVAEWFDRHGWVAIAVELGVMLVSGVLAMLTDPWFSPKGKVGAGRGVLREGEAPAEPASEMRGSAGASPSHLPASAGSAARRDPRPPDPESDLEAGRGAGRG